MQGHGSLIPLIWKCGELKVSDREENEATEFHGLGGGGGGEDDQGEDREHLKDSILPLCHKM